LDIVSVDLSFGFPVASMLDREKERIQSMKIPWTVTMADNAFGVKPRWLEEYLAYEHCPSLMLIDPEGRIVAMKIDIKDVIEVVKQLMAPFYAERM